MTKQFRLPHRADSMWEAIGGNNGTLFQQMTEENNRAVEDQIVSATNNQGAYFIAVWDTSDSTNPSLSSTTNCTEASGSIPTGAGAVFADTIGVYIVFASHSVSAGTGAVTLGDSLSLFPESYGSGNTVSGVYLTGEAGGESLVVALPDSSDPGTWTGELTVWGFKVGETGDLF